MTEKRQRHLNKKLQAAIDERKPLVWEFGQYRRWYRGLQLVAETGYAETGHVYRAAVFCTVSLQGAEELRATLDARGIRYCGWHQAVEDFRREQMVRRKTWQE